jgi:hypothetical protein
MVVKETLGERITRYRHLIKHFLTYRFLYRKWIEGIGAFKNKHKNETCFVFATGPSVNSLDLNLIKNEQSSGAKVIGINSYLSSDLADQIKPDYFIISDPFYLEVPKTLHKYEEEAERDIGAIRRKRGFQLVLPHHWQNKPLLAGLKLDPPPIFFNHSENILGGPNGADLLRPRYYIAMTSYIGVSVALYLGFKKIYLCGFDENRMEKMEIDINNHVIWHERHFYPESDERCRRDMTKETGMTLESFCLNVVMSVQSQRKLNDDALQMGAKVLNCNPSSFVVGFEKTDAFLAQK